MEVEVEAHEKDKVDTNEYSHAILQEIEEIKGKKWRNWTKKQLV